MVPPSSMLLLVNQQYPANGTLLIVVSTWRYQRALMLLSHPRPFRPILGMNPRSFPWVTRGLSLDEISTSTFLTASAFRRECDDLKSIALARDIFKGGSACLLCFLRQEG